MEQIKFLLFSLACELFVTWTGGIIRVFLFIQLSSYGTHELLVIDGTPSFL